MAYRDLEQFLRNLSKHSHLREAFKKDPQKVMSEAGLTAAERKLVLGKDKAAIKKYMGDKYAAALSIQVP